jgi:D-glycero-alpha-D-manno-heptose-7-phosphate kinase
MLKDSLMHIQISEVAVRQRGESRETAPQSVAAIRSRAPLRLGLAGGGTDVSPYSEEFGGAILNATIDRYAFAFIERSPDSRIRFVAADLGIEEVLPLDLKALAGARLQLHAAVYRRMISSYGRGQPLAITLTSSVDAPPGSGLGSSSALVVALVEAFRAVLDAPLSQYEIAHLAYEIERVDLGLAGGKQDQYAAAFGGINFIEFLRDDRVIVNPLRVGRGPLLELEASLITCFSGISRRSDAIIGEQQKGMTGRAAKTIDNLHQLKADAVEMKIALLRGDVAAMAALLDRSWTAKKETATGVSTPEIDRLVGIAKGAGALAGKVSGAGGGGFIMFIAPPECRLDVIAALNAAGGQAEGVHLTFDGAESWASPAGTAQ